MSGGGGGLKNINKFKERKLNKGNTVWRIEMSYMVWSLADRKLTWQCMKYGKLVSGLLSRRLRLMADFLCVTSKFSSSTSF